jgi:hypothetical protein
MSRYGTHIFLSSVMEVPVLWQHRRAPLKTRAGQNSSIKVQTLAPAHRGNTLKPSSVNMFALEQELHECDTAIPVWGNWSGRHFVLRPFGSPPRSPDPDSCPLPRASPTSRKIAP